MNSRMHVAVIIDPFSSGRHFAPLFRDRGLETIGVLSQGRPLAAFAATFHPEDFAAIIRHEGDLSSTLAHLRDYEVRCVVTGSEAGVELSDAIAEALGCPGNGTAMSAARRDKHLMQEAVRSSGIRAAKQVLVSSKADMIAWIDREGGYPVVVKPTRSGGTDGVALCDDAAEAEAAFDNILGADNRLGGRNEAVLVQEFLCGTEYVVDTVSWEGQVVVTAVWRYEKRAANGSRFVYHSMELVEPTGSPQDELVAYVTRVLEALQIRNGAAHSEVMMCAGGPVLVETGARIHGGNGTLISGRCRGFNQIDLIVDLAFGGKRFAELAGKTMRLPRHALEVFLVCRAEGILRDNQAAIDNIRGLASADTFSFTVKPGDPIHKTIDMFTSPGRVVLIHDDPAVIAADYARIRALEEQGLYPVETARAKGER